MVLSCRFFLLLTITLPLFFKFTEGNELQYVDTPDTLTQSLAEKPNKSLIVFLKKSYSPLFTEKSDDLYNDDEANNVLRAKTWKTKCEKAAAKRCKKACRSAVKILCRRYRCKDTPGLKDELKFNCKTECKSRFYTDNPDDYNDDDGDDNYDDDD